ncbi:DUF3824 domain-containing protein [Kitasatospora sp. CMC57]|uniref:DUF3824 domain-containing protein n=1 Tax=Kitasatospora sp. CMC57 TaxID=3231513 RepID=A0AB33K014_9ACTN
MPSETDSWFTPQSPSQGPQHDLPHAGRQQSGGSGPGWFASQPVNPITTAEQPDNDRYGTGRFAADHTPEPDRRGAHHRAEDARAAEPVQPVVPVQPDRAAVGDETSEVVLAPYRIPQVPDSGWDPMPSPRRRWIGRGLLFGVLAVQTALSLRLNSAAHPDEAAVMIGGRQQWQHLLHDTPVTTHLLDHFPGAVWLYPPMAGAATDASGVFGPRVLSLVFALIATALLYALTRRLFNERTAICAAAAYAVLQSTVVVGFYAAPDALAVMLVALAAWIVVATHRLPVATVLLAVPVTALAVTASYAAVVTLPALLGLALITAWPHRGVPPSVLRVLLLAAGTGGLLAVLGSLSGVTDWLSPERGTQELGPILTATAQWSGLFTVLACAGAIAYARRERMNEAPDTSPGTAARRRRRIVLGITLCAAALLIPAGYLYLHSSGVMFRQLGYGMLLAAPLAGVGITRLVGAHFRHPQLGILVWVALLALGLDQAALRFQNGPDSGRLMGVLRANVTAEGRFLTEIEGLPEYYLGGVTKPDQWVSARAGTDYQDQAGVKHRGLEGSTAAIKDGWFNLVVLDSTAPAATDRALSEAVRANGRYRLIAQFTATTVDASTYKVYLLH